MRCIANLTGTVGTETVTAFVTADVSPDGRCLTFTVTNLTPSNLDGSSPLIDQFFFNLNADFLTTLISSVSAIPAWTFASEQTEVTPQDCGIFNYKFSTHDVDLKLINTNQSTGVFTICSSPGTFSNATLDGVQIFTRFQNVGTEGGSGWACGTWNDSGIPSTSATTSTSTTPTSGTSTNSITTPQAQMCPLVQPIANMEQALANTLNVVLASGNVVAIENILKLIIKKEMLLEFLLEACQNLGLDYSNSL